MAVLLVAFLSTVVLHSVSAGGAYCAKTARARAAALGLDYPGVRGAPDLHGAAPFRRHPSTVPLRPNLYGNYDPDLAENEPNIPYYRPEYPGLRSSDGRAHKQAYPQTSESTFSYGTYDPVQSEYATKQLLSFPRGLPVRNHDEVKQVSPPTWASAPKLLPFVYNEHDNVFDASVPNRHAMSFSSLALPQIRAYGANQRGLTGHSLGRVAPVLGFSNFNNQPHIRAMSRRGPMFVRWPRPWFSPDYAQLQQRNFNVKQFVQGNTFPRL
ncbi:hypothetical protein EXN66_Car007856 [Channa argus]|uniref:Uncharacterized protein n=1 Tax=Channa argus TaxID=215402 RepID=A0A6G1PPF0_CHAAH|nr:hypothetical protein EXN66_Car007856 [Channa argus]KAK2909984.1 hypothetical protein Q8A73_007699 [Channa argus]